MLVCYENEVNLFVSYKHYIYFDVEIFVFGSLLFSLLACAYMCLCVCVLYLKYIVQKDKFFEEMMKKKKIEENFEQKKNL